MDVVRDVSDQLHRIQQQIDEIQYRMYAPSVPKYTLLRKMQARLAALLEELREAGGEGSPVDVAVPANSPVQQQMEELARVNETLQTEITASRNTEAQLRAALGKKDALLKEIHHRVKNNMQIISSLLAMQTESMTDAGTIAILKESQRRIRSMALVHQQLYQSADLGTINVREYIQKLIADLADACGIDSGRIRVELHVPSIFWRIDAAVPCGLILTELISNAFKHAFPDGRMGEIHIELRMDTEGYLTMSVRDNGVGFACELEGRKHDSLGLQLVSSLTDQLDGMMQLETHAGTAIHITFPV